MRMGLVVLADIVAPLLLLDASQQVDRTDYYPPALPPSMTSTVLIARGHGHINGVGARARASLHRRQHDILAGGDDDENSAKAARAPRPSNVWNLPNGRVELENPLTFEGIGVRGRKLASDPSSSASLWNPAFLGSGGSGAVFSLSTTRRPSTFASSPHGNDENKVAVKVSWKRSRASVENECAVLRGLEDKGVRNVERCLGGMEYPREEGRTMIALAPVLTADDAAGEDGGGGITSALERVRPGEPSARAVKSVVETLVGMLSAGVCTTDVQPLIVEDTGEALFIDFTEARFLSDPLSSVDRSVLVGFCNEMLALVPDVFKDEATDELKVQLVALENAGKPLPEEVGDVLKSVWFD